MKDNFCRTNIKFDCSNRNSYRVRKHWWREKLFESWLLPMAVKRHPKLYPKQAAAAAERAQEPNADAAAQEPAPMDVDALPQSAVPSRRR